LHHCDNPDINNLKRKKIILAYGFRVQSMAPWHHHGGVSVWYRRIVHLMAERKLREGQKGTVSKILPRTCPEGPTSSR
jgi:hypothetical protein